MPNEALTAAIKEAYASAPSNEVILETIALTHSALGAPIYLVKNREDIIATLETAEVVTFEGASFKLTLPPTGDNGLQQLSLSIDNVDRRITDFVNTVKKSTEAVQVAYRVYLASDLSQPQTSPPLILSLGDISLNAFEASGRASFADIVNKKAPSEYYTRSRFPSLGN